MCHVFPCLAPIRRRHSSLSLGFDLPIPGDVFQLGVPALGAVRFGDVFVNSACSGPVPTLGAIPAPAALPPTGRNFRLTLLAHPVPHGRLGITVRAPACAVTHRLVTVLTVNEHCSRTLPGGNLLLLNLPLAATATELALAVGVTRDAWRALPEAPPARAGHMDAAATAFRTLPRSATEEAEFFAVGAIVSRRCRHDSQNPTHILACPGVGCNPAST